VLIDVLDRDSVWREWSKAQLRLVGRNAVGLIDPVILAELYGRARASGKLQRVLGALAITTVPLEAATAARAGAAFRLFRARRGRSEAILADFLIGAHAVTLGAQLLTRDRARFASYFPELTIIAPEDPAP